MPFRFVRVGWRLGIIACAAVLLLAGCAAPAMRDAKQSRYHVVGYVLGGTQVQHIDAEKLTALNYAFALVGSDGRITLDESVATKFLAQLRALKSRNPRLKILLSVGGWGADGFSDAALTEASRTIFADSAAALLAKHALDGIDIDWEYPGLPGPGVRFRAEDKRNFTLLLESLRKRLDALALERHRGTDRYLLTAALADGEFTANIELGLIHRSLDWINLMTYDFHNSLTKTTGHHAALSRSLTSATNERSVEAAVGEYLAAGVPAHKLIVGVPFYARAFADVQPDNHGLDQAYGRYSGDPSWAQLVDTFIDHEGFVRYWDDVANAPYLWNAREHIFITYDDPQSIALKARFVKTHELGGMMYWEQSLDRHGQLLGVIDENLRK